MACYRPWVKELPSGPRRLPCGQCIGCRLEYAREWAVRITHEASLHERNSFLTLTYEDKHLPKDGFLDKRAVPKFIERLRKRRRKLDPPRAIRYYTAGEYGERRARPHYHVCLFGEDFRETRVRFKSKSAFAVWVSSELCELWPYGQSLIGSLTFESASYVARYVCDKVTGQAAELHYEEVDPATGEIVARPAEFSTMSRRPGIGAGWLEKYKSDVYPSDEVVLLGVSSRPPRFYDRLLEREDPAEFKAIARKRLEGAFRKPYERSKERLQVREVLAESRFKNLQRSLDL